jgi:hypothetical protein
MADSLSDFYAGGSRVPAGTQGENGAIPSSGQISLSDFYGAPKVLLVEASFTYNGYYNSESNSTSYSSSFSIGSAPTGDQNRLVVVCASGTGNNSGAYINGCTIGGVTATQAQYTYSSDPDDLTQNVIYYASIASGTSLTVTVTLGASTDRFGMSCLSVYDTEVSTIQEQTIMMVAEQY